MLKLLGEKEGVEVKLGIYERGIKGKVWCFACGKNSCFCSPSGSHAMGLRLPGGHALGLDHAVNQSVVAFCCSTSGRVSEDPIHRASSVPLDPRPELCLATCALPLAQFLPSGLPSPSEGSAIDTHPSAPHASWGAYFQQLASFPNLLLPICCYQAFSLLILLNFYLFPLGCLRHACISLHMPKHLLLSALGWFLPLCCRSESCCFLFGRGTNRGIY